MNENEIFTLWIPDDNKTELPMLAHLALKSMILCGHDVILYTYSYLDNVPDGVTVLDANEIVEASKIFRYKTGKHKTYSGFANLFRLKRLYMIGGTWADLDIVLIKNINEKFADNIIICSEPIKILYLHPNNAILKAPPKDPFIKSMLDYAENMGSDIFHSQTGPALVSKTLKGEFYQYNRYLKHFNFNNLFSWEYIDDFTKTPKELFNNLNMDEIVGFHFTNTHFKKLLTTKNPHGLYEILKKIILESESPQVYREKLDEYGIKNKNANMVKKYINLVKNESSFKYTFLIDSKDLKKVEIYNIIHSIGYYLSFNNPATPYEDSLKDKQIIIFGKTNLNSDKVKFKDNIIFIPEDFERVYWDVKDLINGDYIIPIKKPVIFEPDFFEGEVSQIIEKFNHENMMNNYENIFDFGIEEDIRSYYYRSDDALKLMDCINQINNLKTDKNQIFLEIKHKLLNFDFKNICDEISYHYYSSYLNITESSYYFEYLLKEENTILKCLNEIFLNQLSDY